MTNPSSLKKENISCWSNPVVMESLKSTKAGDNPYTSSMTQRSKRESMDSAIDTCNFTKDLDQWETSNLVDDVTRKDGFMRGMERRRGGGEKWREKCKLVENEDDDLIHMMKNILLEQKLNDRNAIEQLREEVCFLKNEIQHKNKVITLLLDDIRSLKEQRDSSSQHSQPKLTSSKRSSSDDSWSLKLSHTNIQQAGYPTLQPSSSSGNSGNSSALDNGELGSESDTSFTSEDEMESIGSSLPRNNCNDNDSFPTSAVTNKASTNAKRTGRLGNTTSMLDLRAGSRGSPGASGGSKKSSTDDSFDVDNINIDVIRKRRVARLTKCESVQTLPTTRTDNITTAFKTPTRSKKNERAEPGSDFPKRYLQRTRSLPPGTQNLYRAKHAPTLTTSGAHVKTSNAVLVVGDCLLHGTIAKQISKELNLVVRCFPRGTIEDFYHYLIPLLETNPETVILHCGTNDATSKTSEQVLNDLLMLRDYVQRKVPLGRILLSFPVIRNDATKECYVIENLRRKLDMLGVNGIDHQNIEEGDLDKKGFKLNKKGRSKFVSNFVNYVRTL